MISIRKRPRLAALFAVALYLFAGLTVTDVHSVEFEAERPGRCPTAMRLGGVTHDPDGPASREAAKREASAQATPAAFTVFQGNLWMLPSRPLLMPYLLSTDRRERLERLVRTIRACGPDVVLLQEVFERSVVEVMVRHFPDYRVVTSDETDFAGTVNASGLVTLTRLPVTAVRFHPFDRLPGGSKTIEVIARKGVLEVEVAGPDFAGTLLNLHLYAPRHDGERAVARDQLNQALAVARDAERRGRQVLLAGDFNLAPHEMTSGLPDGWALSEHGPTYDPMANPYTVQGSNDTPGNHRDRRLGRGVRTIDFLAVAPSAGITVRSRVMDSLLLSDHHFLLHTVVPDRPTMAGAGPPGRPGGVEADGLWSGERAGEAAFEPSAARNAEEEAGHDEAAGAST